MTKEQRVLILNRPSLQKDSYGGYSASFVPVDPTAVNWLETFDNWLQSKSFTYIEYGRAEPAPENYSYKERLNFIMQTNERQIGMVLCPPTFKETYENGEIGYTINFKCSGPMYQEVFKLLNDETQPFLICVKALVDHKLNDTSEIDETLKSIIGLHILPSIYLAKPIPKERLQQLNPEMG